MTISDRKTASSLSVSDRAAHLALLAHDLRAAVSDIVGGIGLLPLDRFDPETRIQMERVRAAGEALQLLIEDGLAMMAGEADSAGAGRVSLSKLIDDVEKRWGGRAREKGLDLLVTFGPEVPDVELPDRVALERVLSNALSNAMKYSERGTIRLDVEMARSGALLISVTDHGPGFSPEAMARIFDYGGRPTGAVKPGQGLGLHITRRMSGRLGATIIVENRPEGGARVALELPPESWHEPVPDVTSARPDLPDLSGQRVLIAEDNATNRAVLSWMVAMMGASCTIAMDGAEARDLLLREHFDLALVDIEMPRRSGLEVIRDVQRVALRPPVIAVTAHVLRANHQAILSAGADAILAKPIVDIGILGRTIAGVLDRKPALPAPYPANGHLAPALDHLLQTAGPAVARDVLSQLCADLQTVRRDLAAGLANRRAPLVAAASHVLIALAGTVGANGLGTLALELNLAAQRGQAEPDDKCGIETLDLLGRLIASVERERRRREGLS